MEVKNNDLEDYARPEGVEVKVSAGRINILGLLFALFIMIAGAFLFNYVWGTMSSYEAGYDLGRFIRLQVFGFKGLIISLGCFSGYILFQYLTLYWFSGRDRRALHWNTDLKSIGFLLMKPLALKYYRIALLLPFFVMGVLPLIHGFCTGNILFYFIGMFCIICSSADCYYFWKLRSFNDEDKIVDGDESFSATIIKGSY